MYRRILALILSLALLMPGLALAESLPYVEDCALLPGQSVELRYFLPASGRASLRLTTQGGADVAVILSERMLLGGLHVLTLDEQFFAEPLAEGAYRLILTYEGQTYTAVLTVGQTAQSAQPTPAAPEPTAMPEPTAAPEPAFADQSASITPAHLSSYHPQHTGCYWCTPMDITDESAVWAMLTAPIQVVDVGQKEQVVLRAEPSDSSEGIGVVTGASQAVHVLETRSDGWSLVETYSSSFHDSKVKAWNAFVTGYIRTNKLKTYNVRTDYGMIIDKLTQSLYIFKDGKLFTTLAVSTGLYNERQPYNETRSGEFVIISRVGDFKSDNLVCGMGLRFNSGDLLHEVPHVKNADGTKNYKNCEPKLGSRASHGCVRVQRLKNADGINMTWVWNNIKVGTKLVIWEDFAGRQMEIPADETPLYYNPDGGSSYHSTANCKGVKDKYLPLTAFTYGELETGAFAKLTACAYCFPPRRRADIEEINRVHETQSPGLISLLLESKQ